MEDDLKESVRQMVQSALADGQKIGFDTSISLCRRMAADMKGDFATGADLCADMIEKLRDTVQS